MSLDAALLKIERNYKQACYRGDVDTVTWLLSALPTRLEFVSDYLIERHHGAVWAAYGQQAVVFDFICSVMKPQQIFGDDWDLVLQFLSDDPVVFVRVGSDRDPLLSNSVLRALLRLGAFEGYGEFHGILRRYAEQALDNEVEIQFRRLA